MTRYTIVFRGYTLLSHYPSRTQAAIRSIEECWLLRRIDPSIRLAEFEIREVKS